MGVTTEHSPEHLVHAVRRAIRPADDEEPAVRAGGFQRPVMQALMLYSKRTCERDSAIHMYAYGKSTTVEVPPGLIFVDTFLGIWEGAKKVVYISYVKYDTAV